MKALTRKEKILNGDNIAPLTRPEIFTKKAVNEGGGGLPPYTENDEGKALTVKKAALVAEYETVVPEQDVNYVGVATDIDGGTISTVTEGDTLTMLVNGMEIDASASVSGSSVLVSATEVDVTYYISYNEGRTTFEISGSEVPQGNYFVQLRRIEYVHPKIQKTILPQVTVTLEANSYFGLNYWAAAFPEDANVDTAFFENAEVGDKATFVLDGETYESTAVNYLSSMVLFPIGEIYVAGYASIFGGVGLAAMEEPAEMTHTISGTARVPKMESAWVDGFTIPEVVETGNNTISFNNKTLISFEEMKEMIEKYPIVALIKGNNDWLSCGYKIAETTQRRTAQYHFVIFDDNDQMQHLELGVDLVL